MRPVIDPKPLAAAECVRGDEAADCEPVRPLAPRLLNQENKPRAEQFARTALEPVLKPQAAEARPARDPLKSQPEMRERLAPGPPPWALDQ